MTNYIDKRAIIDYDVNQLYPHTAQVTFNFPVIVEEHVDGEGYHHRDDGPAIIYDNGTVTWLIHAVPYSFDAWCRVTEKSDNEKAVLLLRWKNG